MDDIFSGKHTWSQKNWVIYFSNLDILCRKHGIGQGELAKRIGVVNAYREVKTRPNPETIKRICKAFSVSEEWLGSDHGVYENNIRLKINVKQTDDPYKPHGDPPVITIEELTGIPRGMGMGKAVEMLADIYNTKNKETIRSIYKVLEAFSQQAVNINFATH